MAFFGAEAAAALAGIGACVAGLSRFAANRAPSGKELEKRVAFLETVPLFRNQLPKADIPHVARALTRRMFRSGRTLVRQGEMNKDFFVVESGEVMVCVDGEERAVLSAGDFWGDGSLIRKRASAATIEALGPGIVTVLTLNRREFEHLGLHERLSFPKRPAIYNGAEKGVVRRTKSSTGDKQYSPLPPGEEEFIIQALRSDLTLSDVSQAHADTLREVAQTATMCEVQPGCDIVASGEFSKECYVIKRGSVEVFTSSLTGPGSAEFKLAISKLRKHYFSECALPVKSDSNPRMRRSASVPMKTPETSRSRGTVSWSMSALDSEDTLGQVLPSMKKARSEAFELKSWSRKIFGRMASVRSTTPKSCACRVRFDTTRSGSSTMDHLDGVGHPDGVLGPGRVFGEISMFYNSRFIATFRASPSEDRPVVLYAISRKKFKAHLHHRSGQYKEWCNLLDEASILSSLFRSERHELARHASGYLTFPAGELVIEQGIAKKARFWYVVASGCATMSRTVQEVTTCQGRQIVRERQGEDVQLRRGDTFGERSLLGAHIEADYSVRAGEEGLVCLCIDAAVMLNCGLAREDLNRTLTSSSMVELYGSKMQAKRASILDADAELPCVDPSALNCVCILGSGAFGFVVLQEDPRTSQKYALKRMSKGLFDESQRSHICAERDLMSLTDSNFIIRLHCSWRDAQFLYLLQEAALGGSVSDLLHSNRKLFERDSTAMFYVACVIAALEHLHERSIVYRDLKTENVLLDERGYAKLCDMGFARFCLGKTYTCCGTPEYMAPEVFEFTGHGFEADWWSLGVLACELLCGQTPFYVNYSGEADFQDWCMELRKQQDRGLPDSVLPRTFRPLEARDFCRRLLLVSVSQRLGAKDGAAEVRAHKWFDKAKFDFRGFHDQALRPPHVPEPFHHFGPVPDLRQEVPITYHVGCTLVDGGDLATETVTLEEAFSRCALDDRCEGFSCPVPENGESVPVRFKALSAAVKQPGWAMGRKRRELFERYIDDGSDWDASFTLPAAVSVRRRARKHRKGELW